MRPMSVVVTKVCDIFAWFMVVFGALIINNGHNTPGGGFQGGAVVATFLSFLLAAYGSRRVFAWVRENIFGFMACFGPLSFFVFGCLGFPHSFFFNSIAVPEGGQPISDWLPYAGTISLMDLSVGCGVVGALSMIILLMYKSIHMVETGEGMGGERGHDRFER
ncbi:MAG: sodium:proton antiporter [Synergistaceae bacterium]|jgi:multicomponent Na+:H+ antiporter subunit B|nr:sodium:proton antiporter [Synergistaceae bacterium]